MKYDHHVEADESNTYEALESLCVSEFPAVLARTGWLGDGSDVDADSPFGTAAVENARIEMHVECWGRRLA